MIDLRQSKTKMISDHSTLILKYISPAETRRFVMFVYLSHTFPLLNIGTWQKVYILWVSYPYASVW